MSTTQQVRANNFIEQTEHTPFAGMIAYHAWFRLAFQNIEIMGIKVSMNIITYSEPTKRDYGTVATEIYIRASAKGESIGLHGYLRVGESPDREMCCIQLMNSNPDLDLPDTQIAEVYVGTDQLPAYLNDLYAFLTTDQWSRA